MRIVLSVLILVGLTTAAGGTVIEMKRDANVERNIVRLSDIARIHDAGQDEQASLEAVYVTLSPAPGQAKTVELAEVRQRLNAHGVNLGAVIFEGPTATTVRRGRAAPAPVADAPAAVLDLLARFAASELGRSAADLDVAVDTAAARRIDRLAGAGLRLAVKAEAEPVHLGANTLTLIGYAGTEARERWTVLVEVKAQCLVPVAARDIARGRRIAAGDVRLEYRAVGDPVVAALAVADITDRLASRSIREGTILDPAAVADVPIVHRGDMVTVLARAQHIEVRTTGQALEDGAARQVIKVRNPTTRKVFAARVDSARTVLVELGQGANQ